MGQFLIAVEQLTFGEILTKLLLLFITRREFYNCHALTEGLLRQALAITGSTVVLICCKGDCQSQWEWETPISGPSQPGKPLTNFDKI